MNTEQLPSRYRINYSKTSALQYTGNLDVHKIWERALRRAKLPLAYTQGFNKQPRINQAAPLPLGFTSRAELLDIWLEQPLPIDTIHEILSPVLPAGITIQSIQPADLHETALQNRVTAAEYVVILLDPISPDDIKEKIVGLLAQPSLIRIRRQKEYDLRPLIHEIQFLNTDENGLPSFFLRLTSQSGATGRPDEVVSALGYDPHLARYVRTKILLAD